MNIVRRALLASGVACAVLGTASANAETLTVETGTPSGLTTLAMQVIATYGGMDLQINSGQTLTKACLKLGHGEIDAAVCPPPAIGAMRAGKGPYAKVADDAKASAANLRSLFAFSAGHFHAIVRADSDIEKWEDIAGRRVFTGPPSGAANAQSQSIIAAASGFKAGEDYESIRVGWGAGLQAFQDGQFEVFMRPAPVGASVIEQLGPIRLLSLDDKALETEAWKNFTKAGSSFVGVIPANTYANVVNKDEDVQVAEYSMQAAVNASMSDDQAYALTKAFWENLDQAKKDIKVLAPIDPKRPLIGMNLTLHPGALKYYKEIGAEIPAERM